MSGEWAAAGSPHDQVEWGQTPTIEESIEQPARDAALTLDGDVEAARRAAERGGDVVIDLRGTTPVVEVSAPEAPAPDRERLPTDARLLSAPPWKLVVKRFVDLGGALVAIVIAAPLFLIAAIAVKVTSPGPVIFRQTRIGMNESPFTMWKFRSMYADAESRLAEVSHLNEMDGPVFKIKRDPRITPVGRILRRYSIDELPQLFQVLTGSMSLVGVRPPLPHEALGYDDRARQRLRIKPGLTCIWQTSGRSELTFDDWIDMDLEYILKWSLWLDFKLLLKTVPAVFLGRGAF